MRGGLFAALIAAVALPSVGGLGACGGSSPTTTGDGGSSPDGGGAHDGAPDEGGDAQATRDGPTRDSSSCTNATPCGACCASTFPGGINTFGEVVWGDCACNTGMCKEALNCNSADCSALPAPPGQGSHCTDCLTTVAQTCSAWRMDAVCNADCQMFGACVTQCP